MATKEERFALFKEQTKQCLDQMEAQRIKGALGEFLKKKVGGRCAPQKKRRRVQRCGQGGRLHLTRPRRRCALSDWRRRRAFVGGARSVARWPRTFLPTSAQTLPALLFPLQDLAALTSALKATLDTPEKHCLFGTIRSLIPGQGGHRHADRPTDRRANGPTSRRSSCGWSLTPAPLPPPAPVAVADKYHADFDSMTGASAAAPEPTADNLSAVRRRPSACPVRRRVRAPSAP